MVHGGLPFLACVVSSRTLNIDLFLSFIRVQLSCPGPTLSTETGTYYICGEYNLCTYSSTFEQDVSAGDCISLCDSNNNGQMSSTCVGVAYWHNPGAGYNKCFFLSAADEATSTFFVTRLGPFP